MPDESAAQRAHINEIAHAVPEFHRQKINLPRFITAVMLVNITKGSYEQLVVEVIKSKIFGATLHKVSNETIIDAIIKKL